MKKQDKDQAGAWFTDAVNTLYGRILEAIDTEAAGTLGTLPSHLVRAVAINALVKALASMNLSLRMLENADGTTARGLRPPKFEDEEFRNLERMTAPVAVAEEKPVAKAVVKRGRPKKEDPGHKPEPMAVSPSMGGAKNLSAEVPRSPIEKIAGLG